MSKPKFATPRDRAALRPTRFPHLAYRKDKPWSWRIVATGDGQTIGPRYRTRTALLANLDRAARDYGATP